MKYAKKLIHGTLLVSVSGVLAAIFSYLLRLVLARNFSVEQYGLIFSIMAFFGLFGIIVNLGLDNSLIKFISKFKVKKNYGKIKNLIISILIIQISISSILGIIFILFSNKISQYYLNYPNSEFLIVIFSLFFIISPFLNTLKGIFRGFQKINYYSLIEILQSFLIFFIVCLFIFLGVGISSLFLSYLLVTLILSFIFSKIFINRVFPEYTNLKFYFDDKLIKDIVKFGMPLFMVGSFGVLYGRLDTVLLSIFTNLKDVGYYNVAFPTIKAIWVFSSTFVIVLLPMLSEMWTKKDFDKIIKVIDKIYTYSLILVLPISILVFMFPELILSILFGEKFIPASSVLRILSFLIILQVLIKFNNSILIGTGFTNELPKYLITGGVLNIIGNLCLIPFFGLEGAAYSTLFAFSFIFLVSTYKVNKILNLNLNFKKYLKIIFLSSLFMILVVFFRNIMLFNELLNSIFSVLIGFSIYIFLVYKLNIVNLKEIYNLSK